MSWEVQGRQFHGWFGNGTGGQGTADPVGAVLDKAAGLAGGRGGAAFLAYLRDDGAGELREALPICAGASDLDAGAFRRLVVGAGLGERSAARLQEAGRRFAAGDVDGAGVALAGVVASEPAERLRYGLVYARDQAVYASVNGLVPGGVAASEGDAAGGVERAGYRVPVPAPAGPLPPFVVPGGPENVQNGKDWMAFWRWLLDQRPRAMDVPELSPGDGGAGMPVVSPMQPPKDAKDPNGPKAPGKPGAADGFEDPKGGEQWVQAPNGKGYGWLDKNGDVWVPTGWAGAPGTGTTGPAHGGPHWDVQSPNRKHRNVRPKNGE